MNLNPEPQRNKRDLNKRNLEIIKWIVITILLTIAIVGNQLYYDVTLPLRILVVLILIFIASVIASFTEKGKLVINFIRESRIEIRNIIWPTRKETLYTALIVMAISTIVALILWGLDSVLVYCVFLITKLRF